MVCDSVNEPSRTTHLYIVPSLLGPIMKLKSGDVITLPVDTSTHWMEFTGIGVEHVMLAVSPGQYSLFPEMSIAVSLNN